MTPPKKIYGPWIKRYGGECPVPPDTLVKLANGEDTKPMSPAALRKLLEERDRFWRALHTISKYMPPRELETKSERVYGLTPSEATEYAYENVLNTAKGAIKGTRKPS